MQGDYAVQRLTAKYLLNKPIKYVETGWISQFLSFYNQKTKMWGNGIYGPKWISTFYTLKDLISLEVDPNNKIVKEALNSIIDNLEDLKWNGKHDICVVAMLLSMVLYIDNKNKIIKSLVDELTTHQHKDGGWNCASKSEVGSVHTTLSVLEAYRDLKLNKITYKKATINKQEKLGQQYLLKRKLMYRLSNNRLIFSGIDKPHFPVRWKYDVYRALAYFASINYKENANLTPGINLLRKELKKGFVGKGISYSGLTHFKLETKDIGYMNTLIGLKILKFYDKPLFNLVTKKQLSK